MRWAAALAIFALLSFTAHAQQAVAPNVEDVPAQISQPTPTLQSSEEPGAATPPRHDDALILDGLVARAADRVQERQDYYWGIAVAVGAVVLGLFTFIGVGQIGDIRKSVRDAVLQDMRAELAANPSFQESVAARIRTGLVQEFANQSENMRRDMRLVRLQVMSERVRTNADLDLNDRDALREDLLGLADRPDIVNTPAYRIALKSAADFFFQKGYSREIDLLDDQLGSVIRASRDNLSPMVRMMQHYGLRLIGSMDEVEPGQATIDRFMKYVNGLKRNHYLEQSAHYAIAWELQSQRAGWEQRVNSIWKDIAHSEHRERAILFDNLEYCSAVDRLSPNPGPVHHKLAAAMVAIREKYPAQVAELEKAFRIEFPKGTG